MIDGAVWIGRHDYVFVLMCVCLVVDGLQALVINATAHCLQAEQ